MADLTNRLKKFLIGLVCVVGLVGGAALPAGAQAPYWKYGSNSNLGNGCNPTYWDQGNSQGGYIQASANSSYTPNCLAQVKMYYSDMYGHYHLYASTFQWAYVRLLAEPGCDIIWVDYNYKSTSGSVWGYRVYAPL